MELMFLLLILIPEVLGNLCTGRRSAVIHHPESCKKFIVCQDGEPTELTCPGDLYFDIIIRSCILHSLAHCGVSYGRTTTAIPLPYWTPSSSAMPTLTTGYESLPPIWKSSTSSEIWASLPTVPTTEILHTTEVEPSALPPFSTPEPYPYSPNFVSSTVSPVSSTAISSIQTDYVTDVSATSPKRSETTASSLPDDITSPSLPTTITSSIPISSSETVTSTSFSTTNVSSSNTFGTTPFISTTNSEPLPSDFSTISSAHPSNISATTEVISSSQTSVTQTSSNETSNTIYINDSTTDTRETGIYSPTVPIKTSSLYPVTESSLSTFTLAPITTSLTTESSIKPTRKDIETTYTTDINTSVDEFSTVVSTLFTNSETSPTSTDVETLPPITTNPTSTRLWVSLPTEPTTTSSGTTEDEPSPLPPISTSELYPNSKPLETTISDHVVTTIMSSISQSDYTPSKDTSTFIFSTVSNEPTDTSSTSESPYVDTSSTIHVTNTAAPTILSSQQTENIKTTKIEPTGFSSTASNNVTSVATSSTETTSSSDHTGPLFDLTTSKTSELVKDETLSTINEILPSTPFISTSELETTSTTNNFVSSETLPPITIMTNKVVTENGEPSIETTSWSNYNSPSSEVTIPSTSNIIWNFTDSIPTVTSQSSTSIETETSVTTEKSNVASLSTTWEPSVSTNFIMTTENDSNTVKPTTLAPISSTQIISTMTTLTRKTTETTFDTDINTSFDVSSTPIITSLVTEPSFIATSTSITLEPLPPISTTPTPTDEWVSLPEVTTIKISKATEVEPSALPPIPTSDPYPYSKSSETTTSDNVITRTTPTLKPFTDSHEITETIATTTVVSSEPTDINKIETTKIEPNGISSTISGNTTPVPTSRTDTTSSSATPLLSTSTSLSSVTTEDINLQTTPTSENIVSSKTLPPVDITTAEWVTDSETPSDTAPTSAAPTILSSESTKVPYIETTKIDSSISTTFYPFSSLKTSVLPVSTDAALTSLETIKLTTDVEPSTNPTTTPTISPTLIDTTLTTSSELIHSIPTNAPSTLVTDSSTNPKDITSPIVPLSSSSVHVTSTSPDVTPTLPPVTVSEFTDISSTTTPDEPSSLLPVTNLTQTPTSNLTLAPISTTVETLPPNMSTTSTSSISSETIHSVSTIVPSTLITESSTYPNEISSPIIPISLSSISVTPEATPTTPSWIISSSNTDIILPTIQTASTPEGSPLPPIPKTNSVSPSPLPPLPTNIMSTLPPETTPDLPPAPVVCRPYRYYTVVNPESTKTFYYCVLGTRYLFKCPHSYEFDPDTHVCENPKIDTTDIEDSEETW